MTTYSIESLRERSLDIQGLPLPEGMGVGALRHQLADGTRDAWREICKLGPLRAIYRSPGLFLGKAAFVSGQPIPQKGSLNYGALCRITGVLEGQADFMSMTDFQHVVTGSIRDEILSLVASHVMNDIESQTGLCPWTPKGQEALHTVKLVK